ncbi:PREDICTED: metal tolerance protein 10-like isoform X2 [Camelina sativa]|uniref:Metal tolerance protein 10-like isoform X2 n=1 Tax=Camelina sativa TaxID=90675 RepID=A0ABM0Y9V1_CAMSA|nr:PREDICTED: metal tolerance protein 10-like isoform X2 [Camelina sativa]
MSSFYRATTMRRRFSRLGVSASTLFNSLLHPPPPAVTTVSLASLAISVPQERNVESLNITRSKGGSLRVSMRWRLSTKLVLHLVHQPRSGSSLSSFLEEMKKLAKSERLAVHISNATNLVLFVAKVYASMESRSMAVIASTLDSLLDLLSGFILWFTANAMRKPNQFHYPIGKRRMQPVGIIVFASVMATLGLQVLLESGRQLVAKSGIHMNSTEEKWMIGIMVSVTIVKFLLMLYCRGFQNEIVRAYAQDHLFDVVTNSIGLATAVLAVKFYWWIDPSGAILISLYTIATWARTVLENVHSLIGRSAPPDFLAKLTFLIWNHHEQIKHIDTVRAYTFGTHYFVEVDIVLPEDMRLQEAHNIGETLQEKLEQLAEVERAFVHIDFEFTHRPEHKCN